MLSKIENILKINEITIADAQEILRKMLAETKKHRDADRFKNC